MDTNQYSLVTEYKIQQLLQSLMGVGGIISISLLFLLVTLSVTKGGRWVILTLLLFICNVYRNPGQEQFLAPLFWPLRDIEPYGRPLCALLLGILLIPAIRSGKGWRGGIGATMIVYLCVVLLMSLRNIAASDFVGFISFSIYFLTFLVLGVGLNRWLQSNRDVLAALWCIVSAGIIFTLLSFIQLAVDFNVAASHQRFSGVAMNANIAGIVLVTSLLPTLYLLLHYGWRSTMGLLLIFQASIEMALIVWTGSRGAALAMIVGLMVMYRRRMQHLAIIALTCGLLAFVLYGYVDEGGYTFDRLFSMADSRSEVWNRMWTTFLANPLFGENAARGESQYLLMASEYGAFGILLLLLFLGFWARSLLQGRQLQRQLSPKDAHLVDLITGTSATVAVGCISDGWMLAMFILPAFCLYIYMAILDFLRDAVALSETGGASVEEAYGHEPVREDLEYAGDAHYDHA